MIVPTAAGLLVQPKLTTRIAEAEVATWRCQDQRAVARTPVSITPWALPRSTAYRRWVLNLWTVRRKACLHELHKYDATIRRLNRGLAGSPMQKLGATLEFWGRRYHVSPYFMAAVAGTESSLGREACSNNRYNVWGLSSCGTGWHVPSPCRTDERPPGSDCWRGWSDAIQFYARFLTGHTPATGGWPGARTTYDYSGYAKCSSCWGRKTAEHMTRLFGVDNSVSYP